MSAAHHCSELRVICQKVFKVLIRQSGLLANHCHPQLHKSQQQQRKIQRLVGFPEKKIQDIAKAGARQFVISFAAFRCLAQGRLCFPPLKKKTKQVLDFPLCQMEMVATLFFYLKLKLFSFAVAGRTCFLDLGICFDKFSTFCPKKFVTRFLCHCLIEKVYTIKTLAKHELILCF